MFHFRPADGNNRLQKQSFLTAKLGTVVKRIKLYNELIANAI